MLISIFFLILASGLSYFLYLFAQNKILLDKSWNEAQYLEEYLNKDPNKHPTGNLKHPWLFEGPTCLKHQSKHEDLVHGPTRLFRGVKLFIYTLPLFTGRVALDYVKSGGKTWTPGITDEQLFGVLTHSVLLVASFLSEDGNSLQLKVPEELPLTTRKGYSPAGMELHFDIESKKLTYAHWQQKDIRNDKDLIACFIVLLIIGWGHPQSHHLGEMSAREIARKGIKTLEPSTRYVLALHDGLMYGEISPLSDEKHFFNSLVDRNSVIQSSGVHIPHNLDIRKIQFRYYNFLYQARGILIGLLHKYNLDVNPEFLFHNIILHSVDHYLAYKHIGCFTSWSMDGSKSMASYYRAKMFWSIWLPDYESFVARERISKMSPDKHPFYAELYQALKALDEEYANSVLASTSF